MLEKLESLEAKYEELNKKLGDPEVIGDPNAYKRLAKAHAELEEIVNEFRSYKSVLQDLEDARAMLREDNDPEFTAMLRDEVDSLESRQEELERRLQILLLPKDPNDEKNVIMEIRGGTGGEEAALFAGTLFRMYSRYAEEQRWNVEIMSSNPTELGGFKEVIFMIEGKGVQSVEVRKRRAPECSAFLPLSQAAGFTLPPPLSAVLPEAERS